MKNASPPSRRSWRSGRPAKLWLLWVLLLAHGLLYRDGHLVGAAAAPPQFPPRRLLQQQRGTGTPALVMGCPCLSSWSVKVNGTLQTFQGCANPDNDVLPWCIVDTSSKFCNGWQDVYDYEGGKPRYYDYCTPARASTNLGCMCKAVWVPPAYTNVTDAKPYTSKPGVVVGGLCASVPNESGTMAGGAWCYTVEKTCANNPKASETPGGHDFDFCGVNPNYQEARDRLPPLDRAASDGLPPVPATQEYAFARAHGLAAFGGYSFTTQSGCKCSPWSWTYFNPSTGRANGTYIGCADPAPAQLPHGAWCPVDPRECPSYYDSFTVPSADGGDMVFYDYCGPVRATTIAGCLCQGNWYDNASKVHPGNCAVAPHWSASVKGPWCTIDRSTCTHVPVGNGADWHWDLCSSAEDGSASPFSSSVNLLLPRRTTAIVCVVLAAAIFLVAASAAVIFRRRLVTRFNRLRRRTWVNGVEGSGKIAAAAAASAAHAHGMHKHLNGSGGEGDGNGAVQLANVQSRPLSPFTVAAAAGMAGLVGLGPAQDASSGADAAGSGSGGSSGAAGAGGARPRPPSSLVAPSFGAWSGAGGAGSSQQALTFSAPNIDWSMPAAGPQLQWPGRAGSIGRSSGADSYPAPGSDRGRNSDVAAAAAAATAAAATAAASTDNGARSSDGRASSSVGVVVANRAGSRAGSRMSDGGSGTEVSAPPRVLRALMQIIVVAGEASKEHREEAVRLWLVPLEGTGGAATMGTTPTSGVGGARNADARVILPGDPVRTDLDLGMSLSADLTFPMYSFIGAGAFAQVHRAILRGATPVAVKLLTSPALLPDGAASPNAAALLGELRIMSRVPVHPNVVTCYGGSDRPPELFIVEELMDCNLAQFIHGPCAEPTNRPPRMPLRRALEIAADVAAGLFFLHPTIVHRDLKPQNILLNAAGVAKIADFGISRIKAETYLTAGSGAAGTVPYTAPECFAVGGSERVSEKSDIYSLGIIMWECLTQQHPWSEHTHYLAIMYAVAQCDLRPSWPKDCTVPPAIRKLVASCWRRNPRERPSSGDLLKKLEVMLKQLPPE